ncbi:PDR/VanB family oxidoreductase [Antrihabitans stalactiti]|uniref:Oxidoreductase n=1 Tax=Antrihabitans stalactiti TaxID=2584121 RepID=A0A848KCJ6_9NOCA|nr:PDR/VanB family oxidoreductase [Antrihabitans stalactiti]NMN93777.1 oxidoreductase [Antrihabitans stalactiti]
MTQSTKAVYREVEVDLVVRRREVVADGVVTLTLADPGGADLPEWAPGAHIDLMLESSLVRQYSLCGKTADRSEWQVGILRDPESRGGSQYVHDKLHEGDKVRVRGPRNHFPLVGARRYVFIAGGIGITPIKAMIDAAVAKGADWHLYYGGRSRATMAFLDELEQHGERVSIFPHDVTGRFDLGEILSGPDPETAVYCCGPGGLLTAVEDACQSWPDGSLHIERFAAKEVETGPDGDTEFVVECQSSGVDVTVPADKTIFDALEEAGIDVLGSCMEGICGTCECDILSGLGDHRDSVLNDTEKAANQSIMICVSRSRSERLVLDI